MVSSVSRGYGVTLLDDRVHADGVQLLQGSFIGPEHGGPEPKCANDWYNYT